MCKDEFFTNKGKTPIHNGYFFTPADGVITNINEKIDAKAPLVEVKGVKFSLADLMQDEYLEGDWLVITIFMIQIRIT